MPAGRCLNAVSVSVCSYGSYLCTGGFKLQMFDLRAHSVLKSFFMQEEIVFWRWVSPQLVGVVTAKAVYHWPFRGETSGCVTQRDKCTECLLLRWFA